ncbi:MAG: hypothetical protein ACYC5M_13865 [Anaerolineae bacterium]
MHAARLLRVGRTLCTTLLILWLLLSTSPVVQGLPATAAGVAIVSREYHRLGYALTQPPRTADLMGRAAALAAPVYLDASNPTAYWIFPPVSRSRLVRSANYNLLYRAAASSGSAELSLQVYGPDGDLLRTVATDTADLSTVPTGTWAALELSAEDADCVVEAGALLAMRITLTDGLGGEVHPLFEVALGPSVVYLPLIVRQAGF